MSVPETPPAGVEPDHREFLYMGIGWMLMDLRQEIEMGEAFGQPTPTEEIVKALRGLQEMCGNYADEHFPHEDRPARSDGF